MRHRIPGLSAIVFGLVGLGLAGSPAVATEPAFRIADLAWLSGGWETAPGSDQIDEHWTHVAGGSMFGVSRTVAGDKTVFFEYLRIEARDDGIYYVAHPKARTPGADFKLVRLAAGEAVFENPAHDFPQRISYRKNDDGTVAARIESQDGQKAQDFLYRPIPHAR